MKMFKFVHQKFLYQYCYSRNDSLYSTQNLHTNILLKLTKECVFSVKNRLLKQIDGYKIRGLISVTFSDTCTSRMNKNIVISTKPHFYKKYVDDTYTQTKKNKPVFFRN